MIIVILILLGLCFGSFVNALVWRLHEQSRPPKRQTTDAKSLSILKGRSMCPSCMHTLAWYDLFPVVSWLSLGGKCRYCYKPISWQYPLVEILSSVLFVISYVYWPHSFSAEGVTLFVFWLLFLVGFMALAVYDIRWFLLPDKIVLPLTILAVAQVLTQVIFFSNDIAALGNSLLGVICLAGLFYLLFQLSRGKWIGGGDVKLGVSLGILAGGAVQSFLLLFLASIIGTVLSLPFLLSKRLKTNSAVPFGPLLLMAMFIVYIFGASIINWGKLKFFNLG